MQNVPNDNIVIVSGRAASSGLVKLAITRNNIDSSIWRLPKVREQLAAHDLRGVYAALQRYGVSQRAIAARTGQSQSEVSEIINRNRQVISYALLLRVCEGLGVPRGWMGLAYDLEARLGGEEQ